MEEKYSNSKKASEWSPYQKKGRMMLFGC